MNLPRVLRTCILPLLAAGFGAGLTGCSAGPAAAPRANPLAPAQQAAATSDQARLRDVATAQQAYFSERTAFAHTTQELAEYMATGSLSAPVTLRTTVTAFCASTTDLQFPTMIWVYDSKTKIPALAKAGDCRTSRAWGSTLG